MTLYDQEPGNWDKIAAEGKTGLRDMAEHFHATPAMALALGLSHSAVAHWHRGENGATWPSERRAQEWLKANATPSEPMPCVSVADTLLVVAPNAAKAAKARRILEMMGCAVEEID